MTSVESFLLACLHVDPTRLDRPRILNMSDEEWNAFLAIAARQHVRPLVRRRLSGLDIRDIVPASVSDALTGSNEVIAYINLAMHGDLALLLKALAAESIPVILLKGAHLATDVYGDITLREMGDLDLMVRREHLDRAVGIALGRGYAPQHSAAIDVDVDVAAGHHLTRLFKRQNVCVEFHWNVTLPGQPYSIDPSDLWARAVPVHVVNANAWALSLEDLVLHLCLHAAYIHRFEFGLRSLCDLTHLLQRRGAAVKWGLVERRAKAWHWFPGTQLALRLSRDLLGAPMPQAAIDALQIDGVSDEVYEAARSQLLARRPPPGASAWGVSELTDHRGPWRKLRYIGRRVFAPRGLLRKQNPQVPVTPWLWWAVYLLRCKYLLQFAGSILRSWVRRNPELIDLEARRRSLRAHLLHES